MSNHDYDVAKWRPITPEAFMDLLGTSTLLENKETIVNKLEFLEDGRMRIVFLAEVKRPDMPERSFESPYLMQLYHPETGKSVCFQRGDVELAQI